MHSSPRESALSAARRGHQRARSAFPPPLTPCRRRPARLCSAADALRQGPPARRPRPLTAARVPASRRTRLARHGEARLRVRARTVRMQGEERPDLTADEIALLERKMGSDQKYTQKQMFREEIESPFRKTRLFLIPAFAASAALGAFIS